MEGSLEELCNPRRRNGTLQRAERSYCMKSCVREVFCDLAEACKHQSKEKIRSNLKKDYEEKPTTVHKAFWLVFQTCKSWETDGEEFATEWGNAPKRDNIGISGKKVIESIQSRPPEPKWFKGPHFERLSMPEELRKEIKKTWYE